MMRLSFFFSTLLLLLSFSKFETRPLRNHDPFSSHFHSISLHSIVKHHLNPESEGRSLANVDSEVLAKSAKVSLTIGFRNSIGKRRHYYESLRLSPGGPNAHHHKDTTVAEDIGGDRS
ncbi:hypothetical protein Lal_00025882 [Lupinus albus]|uniref:Uncharacterized protein n=1 Tax=Lupinus albus TaxID=3870 RepID=A0A6A4Q0L1_LUPAL|nr:hypothetical protein Lalb_Chr09g0327981 [Lupinus albus]KAF1861527.1 hypothetical protein Lal_00025882 [Lupinus albus]